MHTSRLSNRKTSILTCFPPESVQAGQVRKWTECYFDNETRPYNKSFSRFLAWTRLSPRNAIFVCPIKLHLYRERLKQSVLFLQFIILKVRMCILYDSFSVFISFLHTYFCILVTDVQLFLDYKIISSVSINSLTK